MARFFNNYHNCFNDNLCCLWYFHSCKFLNDKKTNSTIVMENFNFDDKYDSIPKLNKNQMKIFKIIVLVLLILLVLGMLFG